MATTEQIVIEIADQVSDNIAPKLTAIATTARDTDAALTKLKASLAAIDANAITKLASELAKVNSANNALVASNAMLNQKLQESAQLTNNAINATKQLNSTLGQSAVAHNAFNQALSQAAANSQAVTTAVNSTASAHGANAKAAQGGAKAHEQFSMATAGARRELIVLAHEMLQGNYTRLTGSLMVIAERTNAASLLFSALGLTIGATAAAIGVVIAAIIKGENEFTHFNNIMKVTGDYAGITASQFDALAASVAHSTQTTQGSARDIMAAIVGSGRVSGDTLQAMGLAAAKMADMTGQSGEKVIADMLKMTDGVTKWATEHNRQYHFLTTAQYEHIRNLEEEGKTEQAMHEVAVLLYNHLGGDAVTQLGYLQKAWRGLKGAISDAWQAMKDWGKPETTGDALKTLQQRLQDYKDTERDTAKAGHPLTFTTEISTLQKQIAVLQAQEASAQAAKQDAAQHADVQQKGISAAEHLRQMDLELDKRKKLTDELKKYRVEVQQVNAAYAQNGNKGPHVSSAEQTHMEALIRQKYQDPKARSAARKLESGYESQFNSLGEENAKLDEQIRLFGIYGSAVNKAHEAQVQFLISTGKLGALSQAKKDTLLSMAQAADQKEMQLQQMKVAEEAEKRVKVLNAETAAINQGKNASKAAGEMAQFEAKGLQKGTQAYKDLTAAVLANNKAKGEKAYSDLGQTLGQQRDNTDLTGPESQVAASLLQHVNALKKQGIDLDLAENAAKKEALRDTLTELQYDQQVQAARNRIYDQTRGQERSAIIEQTALNQAYQKGIISLDEYNLRVHKLYVQMAQMKLLNGNGNFADVATASLGKLVQAYQGVLPSLSDSFGSFFTSIEDGFANSIGKAIVMGGSLKDMLHSVAQDALAGLISALVKLGIQYAVNAALGHSIAAASVGANAAMAAATATAWAPAAALASLASFGTNAAPASMGISSVLALTEGMAATSVAGFESGGYTGDLGRKEIAGVVHGQEFVVNASATAKHRDTLEAMNRGASVVDTSGSQGNNVGSSKAPINVKIENYGTSKDFEVQQLSETDIRIIARDEAKKAANHDAPNAVAAQIGNANSPVSKALGNHTSTQRRRF